jgi:hypothetical protein
MRAGREGKVPAARADGRAVGERLNVQRCQDAADLALVPRCPCCQAALVARMGRWRPYFACRCPRRAERPPGL